MIKKYIARLKDIIVSSYFYRMLLKFMDEVSAEEERYIKANLLENELALYGLLRKHKLTKDEKKRVRLASKQLFIILTDRKEKAESKHAIFTLLTPNDKIDLGTYKSAIDFVFSSPKAKNIALSGAYGAGKSSVIQTYETEAKKPFLHISLAHFSSANDNNLGSAQNQRDVIEENQCDEKSTLHKFIPTSQLEWKIINQLIHQINPAKIPQSYFKVKKNISSVGLYLAAGWSIFFMGLLVYVFQFDNWKTFYMTLSADWLISLLHYTTMPGFRLFALFISFILLGIGLYKLLKLQQNQGIVRKLSFNGTEIEMFSNSEDSYFDKYLNDVLYLFDNIKQDVVIFEDMDRYGSKAIFERLREVNALVNNTRKPRWWQKSSFLLCVLNKTIKRNFAFAPMRFFYLIRDDIFTNKDRTKFFDIIIPVVPHIDASNSYDKFLAVFHESGIGQDFDYAFLQGLSLYIDEMRILLNICNEYIVYFSQLEEGKTEIDRNRMLAMITYKNLFPRDFSESQLRRGFVSTLINSKEDLINYELQRLANNINRIKMKIENANNEHLRSADEVDIVYREKLNTAQNQINQAQIYRNNQQRVTAEDNLNAINQEITDRKETISNNLEKRKNKLSIDIENIERQITEVRSRRIKELLPHGTEIDAIFCDISYKDGLGNPHTFNDVKKNPYFNLLKFLLRKGYIDETYNDYMTYFYPNSLSAIDVAFCRSVTDQIAKEPSYSIDNPALILERLPSEYFMQNEVLNYALVDYILLSGESDLQLSYILYQLEKTKNYKFICDYFTYGKHMGKFIAVLNEAWPKLFSEMLPTHIFTTDKRQLFAYYTFMFSPDNIINLVNNSGQLTTYISENSDFLDIETANAEKVIEGMILINAKFENVDRQAKNADLLSGVYNNSLYKINFENIAAMLCAFYSIHRNADFAHKNHTFIIGKTESPLSAYINENIQEYMEMYLENCENRIEDSEDSVIILLNNPDISDVIKNQYIQVLNTKISVISKIKNHALWTALINHAIVAYSIDNFVAYYKKYKIDDSLSSYINNFPPNINFSPIVDEENVAGAIFNAVSINNEITVEMYRKILKDLNYCFDEYDASDISNDHFKVLVDESILQMDATGLEFVRDKYPQHLYAFIRHNFDKYLALQADEIFRLDETLEIIKWDIDDSKKTTLLEFVNEPLSIVGENYTDAVNTFIILNNLDIKDKPSLYANHSNYETQTRSSIEKMATTGISEIISKELKLDDNLLSVLLESEAISRNHKLNLFSNAMPLPNEETCNHHLSELGLTELSNIFKSGGRRNYEINNEVTKIFDILKSHEWIYDYKEDERNPEKYVVIKNKPKEELRAELLD